MKRLPLIALTLCLTALVAWGCSSGNTGPTVTPPDSIDLIDGTPTSPSDNTTPDDGSTSPDDDSNLGQVGGSTPPTPNSGAISGTNASDAGTSRGKLDLHKDCDGKVIKTAAGRTRAVFNFGRETSNANNANRQIPVKNQATGQDSVVTLSYANWTASNPGKITPGVFSLSAGGTFPGELDPETYSSTHTLNWDYSNTTCVKLTKWTSSHIGPFGGGGSNIEFLDGLRITSNRYQPVLGERYATLGIDRFNVQTSNWISEVVAVDEAFGQTFTTFEINQVGGSTVVRFMWNDTFGIVAFDEPYLTVENDDNRLTFPGYPAR